MFAFSPRHVVSAVLVSLALVAFSTTSSVCAAPIAFVGPAGLAVGGGSGGAVFGHRG